MKNVQNKTKRERIHEKIMENALDIIAGKGLDGLTMRSLAAKTQMTAPNLYIFFSSKDEIYIYIIIRGFEVLYADLKNAFDSHEDLVARIRAMVDAYMNFGMSRERYYDVMFTRPSTKYKNFVDTSLEKISEIEHRLSNGITGLALQAGKSFIGNDVDDERLHQQFLMAWSLMHGMITLKNSHAVDYVTPSPDIAYKKIIDELISSMNISPPQPLNET